MVPLVATVAGLGLEQAGPVSVCGGHDGDNGEAGRKKKRRLYNLNWAATQKRNLYVSLSPSLFLSLPLTLKLRKTEGCRLIIEQVSERKRHT